MYFVFYLKLFFFLCRALEASSVYVTILSAAATRKKEANDNGTNCRPLPQPGLTAGEFKSRFQEKFVWGSSATP